MALSRNENGTYNIRSKAEAKRAMTMHKELGEELRRLDQEHGLTDMRTDMLELQRATAAFMAEKGIDSIPLTGSEYVKLIPGVKEKKWVAYSSEITEAMGKVKPLKSLVSPEIFKKLTRRVVDPEKLNAAVKAGVVKLSQIESAYVEIPKAPYARIFGKGDE